MKYLCFLIYLIASTPGQALNLESFLSLSAKSHPEALEAQIDQQKIQYQRYDYSHHNSLTLDTKAEQSHTLTYKNADPSWQVTAKQYLASSATTITAKAETLPEVSGFDHRLSLEVSQPVHKNRFGQINQIDSEIALLTSQVTELEMQLKLSAFYITQANLYLDWYDSWQTLKRNRQAHMRHQRILKWTRSKASYSIAKTTDIQQIELQALNSEASLLAAEQKYQTMTQAIQSVAETAFKTTPQNPHSHPLLSRAEQTIPITSNLRHKFHQLQNQLTFKKYRKAQYQQKSQADVYLGFSQDQGKPSTAQKLYIGLNWTLPYNDRSERVALEKAGYKRAKAEAESLSYAYKTQLTSQQLVTKTASTKKQKNLHKKAATIAHAYYKARLQEYQRGLIDLERLLSAEALINQHTDTLHRLEMDQLRLKLNWLADSQLSLELASPRFNPKG